LVLLICSFIAFPLIPTNAIKTPTQQSNTPENALNIKTYTTPNSIKVDVSFPRPTIIPSQNYQTVKMQDLPRYGDPGAPVLPLKTIKILIPQGKKYQSIDVVPGNRRMMKGKFKVEYGSMPTPISSKPTVTVRPNPRIYSSTGPFPKSLFSNVLEQHLRGYDILLVTLHPVQYFPKTGELFYFESMTVNINLKDGGKISPYFRNRPEDKILVQKIVDNPDAADTYVKATSPLRPTSIVNASESYDYIIITNNNLNSSFQPLINWKIQKGLKARIVLVNDILNDSDYFANGVFGDGVGSKFNDTAARIRNFIKDAYQNWGIEYVLLGGDTGIIPVRGLYGFVATDPITVDKNMPSDLYYGALDGSWDNDNDTIFGEGVYGAGSTSPENGTAGDEADYFAEVYVGRATVTNTTQAQWFVTKTIWYEQASDDSYFKKALMVGETLDDQTEAGNSLDLVTEIIPQYTTTRLYDRDGTYSKSAVISAINAGIHILNHDGHCNTDYIMGLSASEIDTSFTNTEYFFGYSLGCYAAAFDADSVIEHFIANPNGAFAFISNSRYGWYLPGTTYGSGEQFDRAFFNVLNNTVRNLGKTLQFSKEVFAGTTSNAHRWTYFELNLLGDPETEIVTEISAPTAQFDTNPSADRLSPFVIKGVINLNGTAKRGTAVGATFKNFTVEFGRGRTPGFWQTTGIELVDNGLNETVDGPLATWNTTLVAAGICTLRLVVYDVNGTIGEDRWIVNVQELPAIRVTPDLTETYEGLTFTVSVRITSPEDLYGLDFQLSWNTTFLDYVSHSLYIPREDYPGGVLFKPVQITKNEVNSTAGTYWVAAHSNPPATSFNYDGTVFNMTFQAKINGTCTLRILSSSLTDSLGQPILHNTFGGTVNIAPGFHDVAVANISTSGNIVSQGYSTKISVTIANEGTFTESVNFTVYANGTELNTTITSVAGFSTAIINVTWNTGGWAIGNYTISVNVTAVPGENDTSDNTLVNGNLLVTFAGDVDGDLDVDIFDIVMIAGAYGSSEGQPKYNGNCDLDGDGDVDIFDVVIAAGNYGQGVP
jgi:hypothetical protein